ncbi:alpha/beta hydrolase [Dactylosporangium darangshiense]|uniref:AB hydrolase-1 domain-containing protein n=1 Tax=Dactylosporangium darangshiense TaxID=579108 RepID=A0ABP8CT42_9ACTN
MNPIDIPAPDGTGALRALRFGDGDRLILAAHGITASAMSFAAVARALPADWSLVALDLRGRGGSNHLPGPFGMDRHADDLAAAAKHLGAPVVLTGQSLGAYAALRAAARFPELFSRLVLIDGGLPLPVPTGIAPETLLEATVGPAVARLKMTFESQDAYVAFFRSHPALAESWNDDLDAYVRYDATGEPGTIRSRVNAEAVYADARDMILSAGQFGTDLAGLRMPATLLYAPRGMLGQEPGLLPEPVVAHWAATTELSARLIPDCNHYTILTDPAPARVAAETLTGS